MTKERAIELLTSHLRQCATLMPTEWIDKNGSGELMDAFEMAFDALKKQAEYEEMEEQGRLVVLPCKAGQTIYYLFQYSNKRILPFVRMAKVERIYCGSTKMKFLVDGELKNTQEKGIIKTWCFDDFGKTVFLTREEAEQALKGGADNA